LVRSADAVERGVAIAGVAVAVRVKTHALKFPDHLYDTVS
jgi:hypothetical protein